jgi:Domain of unknown function (DUF4431)
MWRIIMYIGIFSLLIYSAIAPGAAKPPTDAKCQDAHYEPEKTALDGRLEFHKIQGKNIPIIKLDKFVCATALKGSQFYPFVADDVARAKLLQIVTSDWSKIRSLNGKKIHVLGRLFPAHSGHHHTDILVEIDALEEIF